MDSSTEFEVPNVDSLDSLLHSALSGISLDDYSFNSGDDVSEKPSLRSPSSCAAPRAYVEPTPQAFTHGAKGVAITGDTTELNRPRSRSAVLGLHGVAQLPEIMSFESWWMEGKQKQSLILEYHTMTRECAVRLKFPVPIKVTRKNGEPIEPWDLHVGAQMNILGHKVILKKANLETQEWLDCQARKLLLQKRDLVRELSKFRVLVEARGRSDFMPSSLMDALMHGCGLGGRVNIRALQDSVKTLSHMLEGYRAIFLKKDLETFRKSVSRSPEDMAEVQKSWDIKTLRTFGLDAATTREGSISDRESSIMEDRKNFNYLEWLESIPLAASAARRQYVPNKTALLTNGLGLKTASTETLLEKMKNNSLAASNLNVAS